MQEHVPLDGNVQGRTLQRSDTEKLLGGAAEFSQSLKKERAWANRLLLRHVVKHEYPVSGEPVRVQCALTQRARSTASPG